jgi:hypothetical protein
MTSIQNAAVDNQNSNVPNMVNVERDVYNQNAPVNNESTKNTVSNTRSTKTFDCSNSNEYSFVVVENPNRKNEELFMPKDLNIVIGEEAIRKIELPIADAEAKNFSLDSVEKTKAGFEIKVEWGGGKYHYEIQFNFRCKENNFYLYKVKNENFSTTNPDSGNFWDKKETKVTKIEPNLPIEKFIMLDYLQ